MLLLLAMRRLQELVRERKYCFMPCLAEDTCDSMDRELLWDVLVRLDVPQKMLAFIRQFYDGMQAGVWTDDGEHSEWIEVKQGARPG